MARDRHTRQRVACPKEGEFKGQILFKPGTRDFQAEISRLRASKADALFIFVPGKRLPIQAFMRKALILIGSVGSW